MRPQLSATLADSGAYALFGLGAIWHLDAEALLDRIPTASADIVFLDPPFNLRKLYSKSHRRLDDRPIEEYETWLLSILEKATKALKPGGALFLYHLPIWALRVGSQLPADLQFRHWIAVSMKNGFARGARLYPAHYALLYLTKGDPAQFVRPLIRPQVCRTCGTNVRDYGGYRSIIEAKGLNLSDVWDDLSPVRHRNVKLRAANQLPEKLTDRVVEIAGSKGGLLVDPFAGSGTALVSAQRAKMRFLGGDLLKANCQIAARRLRRESDSLSDTRNR